MTIGDSPWGKQDTKFFFQLTPDKILNAIESVLDVRCTGRAFAHNSMENRVYELELEGDFEPRHPYDPYKIVKFYRPGRWTWEQIQEEHRFLLALADNDIPAVAPLTLKDGNTLAKLENEGLYFCVFPKVGGRSPAELSGQQLEQVGRLLARLHNVGAAQQASHRISLTPATYGLQNLEHLLEGKHLPLQYESGYRSLVEDICRDVADCFLGRELIQIHGDCHLGNLLWSQQGPFWVDFDDSVLGPPVQDLWLMILGRGPEYKTQLHQLIRSYEMMRTFDWGTLNLIEPLRALRMIHFHGWIAKRYSDPAFQRAFPDFGSDRYWGQQMQDLEEQRRFINQPNLWL